MKNNSKLFKILLYSLFIIAIVLIISPLIVEPLQARPGGGNSYSGGGGSGGGDGVALDLIIWLILSLPPEISVPLIIIIIVVYIIYKRKNANNPIINSAPTYENRSISIANIDTQIDKLKTADANFSKILFLEFISNLYNKYYFYQNKKEFKNLAPFLSEHLIKEVENKQVRQDFSEIVIGSINISVVSFYQTSTAITVDIDANYTATSLGASTRYIVQERWLLNRNSNVFSPEPNVMRSIGCPNCGASSNFNDAGRCEYCGTFIQRGEMQWFVKDRRILSQSALTTSSLLTYSQEVGTNYPTIYQNELQKQLTYFETRHNIAFVNYFTKFKENTASAYFKEIYRAWTIQNWDSVRHLVADRLWESNNFWQIAYKAANYINRLDNLNISKIELAKIEHDKFYEAITVRIFANCHDYVTDRTGQVLAGSNKKMRYYSEYWTFIRRNGVEREDYNLKTCPNCGAPADRFAQAGVCEYCSTKITNGDFSWILAIITQDEVYKG